MNYTPTVRKSAQTFINVLQKAKDWFASLSATEQKKLIEDLEHGAAHLTNRVIKFRSFDISAFLLVQFDFCEKG